MAGPFKNLAKPAHIVYVYLLMIIKFLNCKIKQSVNQMNQNKRRKMQQAQQSPTNRKHSYNDTGTT
jgi:hypothetical protein